MLVSSTASLAAFVGFFFCSCVYMFIRGMCYLHHEVPEFDGYNQEFWKTGLFFEMCSRVSRLKFTCENTFKGTPLNWALVNVFEDLDFLSHHWAVNRIRLLLVRSTNGIII